jgi:hypothetical protein
VTGYHHLVLWKPGNDVGIDLENAIDDPTNSWIYLRPGDINDAGQIVGYGALNGEPYYPFILTPIPEPFPLGTIAPGFLLLRRRSRVT